jgi:1,2-diacylglycerol-3-alpha-glucose alpha-1,2-galactosyltransferase
MAGELAARIAKVGLKNVSLAGLLDAEQLRDEYLRADIFLFPSTFEGSPKVILEASACGVPVIVRNNYSPATVIQGVTGYQAASDEEIFSALQRLISSPDLRRQLGQAGRLHSQRYDWDLITRQWEEAFERAAESKQELRKAS